MATIIINISGDTIAGMNDKMSAANACYLTWNGEKITSTGKNVIIPVTASGTLGLPKGRASGVDYSYTQDGSTSLGAEDVLTINYTATPSSGSDKGASIAVDVTYNPPSSGETEKPSTPSIDLSTLRLGVGTYIASALANAASAIASALSKKVQYEVVNKVVLYAPSISATNKEGEILISDTINGDNVISYNVYLSSDNGYVTNVARTGTQTSVYITWGVSAYVKAVDSSGNESEASNIIMTKDCFVAGTPVLMADGTYKLIEDVESGDKVCSYDTSTGEYVEGTVTEIVTGYTNRLAMVLFSDSNYLVMAEGHPLYTLGGFHSITNKEGYPTLVIGDRVLGAHGYTEIIDLQVIDTEPTMVYSLAFSKTGIVYFVGTEAVGGGDSHSGGSGN
jgi:hypothetical protein